MSSLELLKFDFCVDYMFIYYINQDLYFIIIELPVLLPNSTTAYLLQILNKKRFGCIFLFEHCLTMVYHTF